MVLVERRLTLFLHVKRILNHKLYKNILKSDDKRRKGRHVKQYRRWVQKKKKRRVPKDGIYQWAMQCT